MASTREIEGAEFDWFAADQEGCIALFATAGSGPIPELVRGAIDAHNEVGAAIEVSDWGTRAVWQSYSRGGLFVYDWSHEEDCYVRIAQPTSPPDTNLQERIFALPYLPTLRLSFAQAVSIGEDSLLGT